MALPTPLARTPIRVVIVDADDRVRESLAGILGTTELLQVLGTAGDVRTGLTLITATGPDVVVLDPRLPDIDASVAFIAAIRSALPRICILAMSWSDPMEHAALSAGADAFVRKTYRSSELIAAIVAASDACS